MHRFASKRTNLPLSLGWTPLLDLRATNSLLNKKETDRFLIDYSGVNARPQPTNITPDKDICVTGLCKAKYKGKRARMNVSLSRHVIHIQVPGPRVAVSVVDARAARTNGETAKILIAFTPQKSLLTHIVKVHVGPI